MGRSASEIRTFAKSLPNLRRSLALREPSLSACRAIVPDAVPPRQESDHVFARETSSVRPVVVYCHGARHGLADQCCRRRIVTGVRELLFHCRRANRFPSESFPRHRHCRCDRAGSARELFRHQDHSTAGYLQRFEPDRHRLSSQGAAIERVEFRRGRVALGYRPGRDRLARRSNGGARRQSGVRCGAGGRCVDAQWRVDQEPLDRGLAVGDVRLTRGNAQDPRHTESGSYRSRDHCARRKGTSEPLGRDRSGRL